MVTELTDITALVYRWCRPVVNEVLFGVQYISDRVFHHPAGTGDIHEVEVPIRHKTIDK